MRNGFTRKRQVLLRLEEQGETARWPELSSFVAQHEERHGGLKSHCICGYVNAEAATEVGKSLLGFVRPG